MTVIRTEPAPESPSQTDPIRWGEAFRAFRALTRDNDDTRQVFRIVHALRGDSPARYTERLRRTEIGRTILAERRSLLTLLADRDALRRMPAGSLGRVYLAFMEREGLTAAGLAEAAEAGFATQPADPDIRTFVEWVRDSHDLWHVLTGYGRDPLGELCLLGVLYSQIGNPGTAFIALLGMLRARSEYPGAPVVRAVQEGFRIGRRAEWLVAQDWRALLPRPVEGVRAELRLTPPRRYRQSLARHQPARSRSRAAAAKAADSAILAGGPHS